jgi:hypothetical protein
VCTCGRAAAAEEETGSSSINGGRGDRRSRERGEDLESFGMKSETTWGGLLFIGSKLSATILKLEPFLIVLELISNSFDLKPLLMKILSTADQE